MVEDELIEEEELALVLKASMDTTIEEQVTQVGSLLFYNISGISPFLGSVLT